MQKEDHYPNSADHSSASNTASESLLISSSTSSQSVTADENSLDTAVIQSENNIADTEHQALSSDDEPQKGLAARIFSLFCCCRKEQDNNPHQQQI